MSLFPYEENGQRDNIKPCRWEIKMMTTKKKTGNPYLFRMIPWALFPNAVGFLFSFMFGDDLVVCRMSQLLSFFLSVAFALARTQKKIADFRAGFFKVADYIPCYRIARQ